MDANRFAAQDSSAELTWCRRLFWGWLVVRTLLWTLVAATQPDAPLDTVEWLYWGREWCLGYSKHPPLAGWVGEIFLHLTPGSLVGVYLASYLSLAVCFGCAWKLGLTLGGPRVGLLSALALEGWIYFGYEGGEYSNNVVFDALWALAILWLHRALCSDRARDWAVLGLVLGLALLTKYTAVVLIAPLVLFCLLRGDAQGRRRLGGLVVAGTVALLVVLPHVVWLIRENFPTFHYAAGRARLEEARPWDRLLQPGLFLGSQCVRFLPVAVVLLPLLLLPRRSVGVTSGETWPTHFLRALVFGPVLLLVLFVLVTGAKLRDLWGGPLWTYLPLLLLHNRTVAFASFLRCGVAGGMAALLLVGFLIGGAVKNVWGATLLTKPQRVHFPGRQLGEEISRRWHARYADPLRLAAGDWWLAGNVSLYAPERPSVYGSPESEYYDFGPTTATWTSDDDLRTRGGVILWTAALYGDDLPHELRVRFPAAEVQPALVLTPTQRVGYAFLSPAALQARLAPR